MSTLREAMIRLHEAAAGGYDHYSLPSELYKQNDKNCNYETMNKLVQYAQPTSETTKHTEENKPLA